MTKKTETKNSGQRLIWPTLGLVVFLLLWLALCTSGFWVLYQLVTSGSTEPQPALTALQWMTWPFTVLCIAGPLVVVLSIGGLRVVRDLLEMQKLILNLPLQLESMQTVLAEFLRAQMITDVSRVRGADDAEGAIPAPVNESPTIRETHVEEFLDMYDEAKQILYPAMEDFNARGGEPLIVERGGANFREIAEALRDKREFDPKSNEQNRKISDFVIRAFELERQSRRFRSYLTPEMIQELRNLRARIKNRPKIQRRPNGPTDIQPNA
jgi:hypothetical protein